MKKKIIAFILCICLISCTCIQPAYAMGAEGFIVGGTAGAVGISLTMPQVALLIAAGFGLIYATQHAEELASGLNNALENAANNIGNGMEQLTEWKNKATTGFVSLASAAPWIIETIKSWVSGLYSSKNPINVACTDYTAGQPVPGVAFWGETTPKTYIYDCTVLRMGRIYTTTSNNTTYWSLNAYQVAVSTKPITSKNITINGQKYYYEYTSWVTNAPYDEPLGEYNQKAYDAIIGLPDRGELFTKYNTSDNATLLIRGWLDGMLVSNVGSICPDTTVGGIENVLGEHDIGNVNIPDMDIGDSKLFNPPADGSIDDCVNDVLTRLKANEQTWSDFMSQVGVGRPTVAIPQEGALPLDFPITDTGVGDLPIDTPIDTPTDTPTDDPIVVPDGLEPFTISLTDFFPFCIPFDIVDFVNVLCAEPEAPRFDWTFTWYGGATDTLTIDLKPFDGVAQLLRNMELLLFCIGLAMITRNQIRG